MENPNTNCLANFQCPECKSFGPFKIQMTALIELDDDGTDEVGDTEWDGGSFCICSECCHDGVVADFCSDFEVDTEEDAG